MDQNGVVAFRHRRSPSSDRFLGVLSPPQTDSNVAGDELNEDDVFWTGDFTEPQRSSTSPASSNSLRRQTFRHPEKFGILAALSEDQRKLNRPVVYRKTSIISSPSPQMSSSPMSSSRAFPMIPKPPLDRENSYNRNNYSQTMPVRKFQHSAPVNIPMMPKKATPRNDKLADVEIDDDEGGDDEMLPPHEIVARGGSSRSPKTTFSVLEGVGRTLKGRDLRQVRNAVFRQTEPYASAIGTLLHH
ncbi:PREDICTED: uncharacterized protein LOC109237746 [Nicotiana attenuata]|uniref:Uncharacterized protein n=1 Tax=Nicotiana attenuata TaxID=49451 RepID=A0A314LDQ3_NICAT|nr:PREDICTED: uncharacterized protein LOC109237746 [Nicotiana attenuata]OIT39696.1 hypothetical protein A4A49_27619 [Nicotiana attenuata]